MVAVVALFGQSEIGTTEVLILAGICAYVVKEGLDYLGLSKSSRLLRRENEDLVRRNRELEEAVTRHQLTIDELRASMQQLEVKVKDLERHDLASVLRAIEQHETSAERRAAAAEKRSQTDQAEGAARHAEHVRILTEIRDRITNPGGSQ